MALAVVVLTACTEPAEPATPPGTATPASPLEPATRSAPAAPAPSATAAEPASACRVERLGTLPSTEPARRLVFLPGTGAGGESTAEGAVLLVEGTRTELVQLTPAFAERGRRTLPTAVEAAIRVGDAVVALAAGVPDADGDATYRVLRLAESAEDDAEIVLPVPVRTGGAWRRNSAGEQVVFTWTNGLEPPVALRVFAPAGGPLRFDAAYPLSPTIDLEEGRAVQLLRVALAGESFAAIVRVGSAEGIGSEVWLTRPSGRTPVEALEDIADIESMAIVGDQVWVIPTFEFSRPLLLRITPSGALAEAPVELARDATLPSELAAGDPARLMVEGERLLLRRRNPMGDPLLPDAVVATRPGEPLPADVLRDGRRYVVVYQERDERGGAWSIRFASLDCAPP